MPDSDLSLIAHAERGFARLSSLSERGQENADQERNDRDNDQKFNEGKRTPPFSTSKHEAFSVCAVLDRAAQVWV